MEVFFWIFALLASLPTIGCSGTPKTPHEDSQPRLTQETALFEWCRNQSNYGGYIFSGKTSVRPIGFGKDPKEAKWTKKTIMECRVPFELYDSAIYRHLRKYGWKSYPKIKHYFEPRCPDRFSLLDIKVTQSGKGMSEGVRWDCTYTIQHEVLKELAAIHNGKSCLPGQSYKTKWIDSPDLKQVKGTVRWRSPKLKVLEGGCSK